MVLHFLLGLVSTLEEHHCNACTATLTVKSQISFIESIIQFHTVSDDGKHTPAFLLMHCAWKTTEAESLNLWMISPTEGLKCYMHVLITRVAPGKPFIN